ncbi:MAG: alpha-galactosidase [Spirochaetes bacterium]|nr:alpha-galactosidase [Spirochaetota bacterium]
MTPNRIQKTVTPATGGCSIAYALSAASPRTVFIEALNTYTERPFTPKRRGLVASHFLTWLRKGDRFLALVSVMADGKTYSEGERIAELRVIIANDFFSLRDEIQSIFSTRERFDSLRFLGSESYTRLVPGGYESWYNHCSAIDESIITADLEGLCSMPNLINRLYLGRGKPTVFEVDDGWERTVGDWRAGESRFPDGMKPVADRIRAKGCLPGLWFAPFVATRASPVFAEKPEWLLRDGAGNPVVAGWMAAWGRDFHCLDLSRADVLDHLDGIIETAIDDWGYRYIKLDFPLRGDPPRGTCRTRRSLRDPLGRPAPAGAEISQRARRTCRVPRLRHQGRLGRPGGQVRTAPGKVGRPFEREGYDQQGDPGPRCIPPRSGCRVLPPREHQPHRHRKGAHGARRLPVRVPGHVLR